MISMKIRAAASLAAALTVLSFPSLSSALTPETTQANPNLKGLWLTTDYPTFTLRMGEADRITLSLRNYNLPPQRIGLTVTGVPQGWTWSLKGGGHDIAAAMVAPNTSESLELNLKAPDTAKPGDYQIGIEATSDQTSTRLPLSVKLAKAQPAELKLEPELPALRGSPRSTFDFRVKITNDGPKDSLINLAAQTPAGFNVIFKQAYGSKEITGIPVKAGGNETVSVEVRPPQAAKAGQYPIAVAAKSEQASATTRLVADITGQPKLGLQGPQGRLSGQATAGDETTFTFSLNNSGSAPAQNIELRASPPTGWKVDFQPKQIAALAPGRQENVEVNIKPSDKAIAGDYVVAINANGNGTSDSAQFRVTVTTSTVWGMVGLGFIAAAVAVLGVAVTRYGRR